MVRRPFVGVQRIEEVRARIHSKRWNAVTYDVEQRLRDLRHLIGTAAGDELHRYFIVSAIASLDAISPAAPSCQSSIQVANISKQQPTSFETASLRKTPFPG